MTQQPPPPGQPSYGQQPPPSGQPSYGQQPSYSQQPPPGQPPPGPQPAYGPPPPPQGKSKVGLIVIISIVVLALVGGAIGGVVAFAGDSDSGGGGETIEGDGYSYTAPDGWEDASGQAGAEAVDSVIRAEDDTDGFHSNVLVEVQPANGVTSPDEIRAQWESNVGTAVGATPEPIDSTTIDGQDAVGLRVQTTQEDIDVVQFAYLAVNDDKVYSVALSANASAEDEASAEFEQVLDSWTWQTS